MQILLSVEQIECVYIDEVQLTMKVLICFVFVRKFKILSPKMLCLAQGNKPPITLESVRDECVSSPLLILELEMDLKLATFEMPKWRNVAIEKTCVGRNLKSNQC